MIFPLFKLELIMNTLNTPQNPLKTIYEQYFDAKISRSFYNYKNLKGSVAILTNRLL